MQYVPVRQVSSIFRDVKVGGWGSVLWGLRVCQKHKVCRILKAICMTTIPCVHFDLQSEEWPAACLRFVVFYYPFLYTWLGSEQPMISWARCWTATSHGGRQRNCTIMSQCVRILFEFIIHNISFDIVDSFIHSFVHSFMRSVRQYFNQSLNHAVVCPMECLKTFL